jgi:hypothetical protein
MNDEVGGRGAVLKRLEDLRINVSRDDELRMDDLEAFREPRRSN